jgi:hypothetical protein
MALNIAAMMRVEEDDGQEHMINRQAVSELLTGMTIA